MLSLCSKLVAGQEVAGAMGAVVGVTSGGVLRVLVGVQEGQNAPLSPQKTYG